MFAILSINFSISLSITFIYSDNLADGKLEGDLSKGVHLTQNITSRMNYYKIIYDRENDDINSTPKYDLDKLQEIYVRFSNNIGKLYTDYIKELEQADQLEINELAGIDKEEEEEEEDEDNEDLGDCGCETR